MCEDYKPAVWNWKSIPQGGTYPASNVLESESTATLNRVVVTIEPYGSDTASLTLDSNTTGVTINNDTAGSWDYTIDEISATTTASLSAGFYTVTMRVYYGAGFVVVVSKGVWEIIAK